MIARLGSVCGTFLKGGLRCIGRMSQRRHAFDTATAITFALALVPCAIRVASLGDGSSPVEILYVAMLAIIAIASGATFRRGLVGSFGVGVVLILVSSLASSYVLASWLHPTARWCFRTGLACDWRPAMRLTIALAMLMAVPVLVRAAVAHGRSRRSRDHRVA